MKTINSAHSLSKNIKNTGTETQPCDASEYKEAGTKLLPGLQSNCYVYLRYLFIYVYFNVTKSNPGKH